jgi:hypothetical protein
MHKAVAVHWPPIVQGLLQRIEHEARMCRARRAPADDAPRIGIDDEGDVDEAGPGLRPMSRSACFSHSFSVCPVQPILAAIDRIAGHRDVCSAS